MNKPRLTIVIPARNRRATLRRTLDSVAAQTLRPLRVVLVDNASTDSTRAIMEQWRDQTNEPGFEVTVTDEPRCGASAARNKGLGLVDTEFVMFFDSDDVMLPTHCADMMDESARRPDADIIGRTALLHLLNGTDRKGKFATANPMLNHIFHSILATQRYICRTELMRRVGGWNTELSAWVDWELGIRLLLTNPVLAKAPGKPTVIVYSQPESITGTHFSHDPAKWEATLMSIRRTLILANRSDLLPLIDARGMILAARYAIEGAGTESRRFATHTVDIARHPLLTRMLYAQHRLMHRGTSNLARLLFPLTAINASRPTPPLPVKTADRAEAEVTIVIPAWNRERTLRRTLDSVYRQTLRPLNIILVDNKSTDSTRAIMEEWQEAHSSDEFHISVLSEPRRGASSARNCGLRDVRTRYVMFFDSDDEMLPTHCADLMAEAHSRPEAAIVGRPVRMHLLNGRKRKGMFTQKNPLFNHMFHSILSTQRYIVRTDLLRHTGCWDQRLYAWEDWELGVRLLFAAPVMARVKGRPTVIVHSQPDSITSTNFSHSPAKWEDALTAVRGLIADSGRHDLLTWFDARTIVLAAKYYREGAYSEARRLSNSVFTTSPSPRRMRLLYYQNRLMGRGTAIAARILFPRTPLC